MSLIPAGGTHQERLTYLLVTCEDLSSFFALKSVHLMIRKVVFGFIPKGQGETCIIHDIRKKKVV